MHIHSREHLGSDLTHVFQIIEDNPLGSLCRGILVLNTYNVGMYFFDAYTCTPELSVLSRLFYV